MLGLCKATRLSQLGKAVKQKSKVPLVRRKYSGSMYDTGMAPLGFTTKQTGTLGTHEYRVTLMKDGKAVSAWHDVPLSQGVSPQGDRLINMVMEIPKGTRAKLEMVPTEANNPIAHDKTKSGEIRYMGYSPVLYNYGFIPQTWEDPSHVHPDTGLGGDNDPLDIIDIGYRRREVGEVYRVKIVGSFALIDEGETDWKILGISLDDPACKLINSVEDIEKHKPGISFTLRDWYRKYKTADGKPENTFAFKGEILDQEYTLKVIDDTHAQWKRIETDPELKKKYQKL